MPFAGHKMPPNGSIAMHAEIGCCPERALVTLQIQYLHIQGKLLPSQGVSLLWLVLFESASGKNVVLNEVFQCIIAAFMEKGKQIYDVPIAYRRKRPADGA